MNTLTVIPEGFKRDARGNLVAIGNIKPLELIRDESVKKWIDLAKNMSVSLQTFKGQIMAEIDSFCDLSAMEYNTTIGGKKGNITLHSFDGSLKVTIAVSERHSFDERLQTAKALIDECVHEWTLNSDFRIKTLINDAFQVDKVGKVSTARILGLRKLEMNDSRWNKAMEAITDSMMMVDSKEYVRFYQRRARDDKWEQITLDLAAI